MNLNNSSPRIKVQLNERATQQLLFIMETMNHTTATHTVNCLISNMYNKIKYKLEREATTTSNKEESTNNVKGDCKS